MRILVFEYVTGGGMAAETLPPSLAREGDLMLSALLRDLLAVAEVQVVALRDTRLTVPEGFGDTVDWVKLDQHANIEILIRNALSACDAAWIIAPETGGILEYLCRIVETAGKPLLTSPAAVVRIAASKFATVRRLQDHGVPVVPTIPASDWTAGTFPVVVKPDDGAGCEGARILGALAEWREFAERKSFGDYVVQPVIDGEALSLSALFAAGRAKLLTCNRQYIVREQHGFVLRGCGVGAVSGDDALFQELATAVAAALPELWGYAGVDVIRSEKGLLVLEINPRLTTSYAGVHAATGCNPAELVLSLWRDGTLPEGRMEAQTPVDIWVNYGD